MLGLVHIYTGDGKGKTTAAIGLAVRAYGSGLKVLLVQFLKGSPSGEINSFKKLDGFSVVRCDKIKKFVINMNEEERNEASKYVGDLFKEISEKAIDGSIDMLILDEIFGAITTGFITKEQVVELIKNKDSNVELVLTGRDAPEEIIELSHYVSEIKAIKHPYNIGIQARKGIEC
jgi:cob(I)alamin adenosyltransferase